MLDSFTWFRSPHNIVQAYEDDGDGNPKGELQDFISTPFGSPRQKYIPGTDEPALFVEFAALWEAEPSGPEPFFMFASKFGNLGSVFRKRILTPGDRDIVTGKPQFLSGWGELLKDWELEAFRFFKLYKLMKIIRNQDPDELARIVQWDDDGLAYTVAGLRRESPTFSAGDLFGPATQHYIRSLSDGMHDHASVQVAIGSDGMLEIKASVKSLIGHMYLQLASSLDKDAEYRQCAECDRYFEVGTEGFRRSKQYCSATCRTRAYRRRRQSRES